MFRKHTFDFDGTDPDSADLYHVIGPSGIPVELVLVLIVLIARAEPVPGQGVLRFLVLIPVVGTRGIGLYDKIADFSTSNGLIVVVNDLRLEPWNDLPTGARTDIPGCV